MTLVDPEAVNASRSQLHDEGRQALREEHGHGVEGSPAEQTYEILLRLQNENSDFHDDSSIHSLDLAEVISPVVRTYLRSNRAYWDSRTLGKGWVVNRDGEWLRCKGLMETHAMGMKHLLKAEEDIRAENRLRQYALFGDGVLTLGTMSALHGSLTRLRRSLRSYSSIIASCREHLLEPTDWFTARSLEWVLTITDRDGVIPDHMPVADIGRAYQKAQHPGGLSWDDLRDELQDLGVIRNHSNIPKVPLSDSLVRETIQDAIT